MERLRRIIRSPGTDANVLRIRRRRAAIAFISRRLPALRLGLFVIGYVWMIFIPFGSLSRRTYIDENALQPGQVNTYWSWADVHQADLYLNQLENVRDANLTSEQRAQFIADEFAKLGLAAATQKYTFTSHTGKIQGTNAYGILSAPRSAGNEAMVISASWLSLSGGGTLNLRGVSTVVALASFLKRYSFWAKDIVFVIGDGYLDGMHAWLSAYHDSIQSNLVTEHLRHSSGEIWTALSIDYPGHSFSHLGIFFEGCNGRLPNQDLLNSFQHISRYTGGVPVILYDHLNPREHAQFGQEFRVIPKWVPALIKDLDQVRDYEYHAKNILRHVGYQARGKPSGIHGLFHQFRIDAFTVFAIPATGPHGFHAIGKIMESLLRTTNNLLERLHASFFFYILTGPETFLKIGYYLPSAVLISIALMFGGLRRWVDAGWVQVASENADNKHGADATCPTSVAKWKTRKRPVLAVLGIIISTHLFGGVLFYIVTNSWLPEHQMLFLWTSCAIFSVSPLVVLTIFPATSSNEKESSLAEVLSALNLCLSSTVISITAVLNFSLAVVLAVILGPSLTFASPSQRSIIALGKYLAFISLAYIWLWVPDEMRKAVWDWEVLGVWVAPFICIVYTPLVVQAGISCLLPA